MQMVSVFLYVSALSLASYCQTLLFYIEALNVCVGVTGQTQESRGCHNLLQVLTRM